MNRKPYIAIGIAAVLWFVMFSPWTSPLLNFWAAMTFSAIILTTVSQLFGKTFGVLRLSRKDLIPTI